MYERETRSRNLGPLLIILAVLIVAVGWHRINEGRVEVIETAESGRIVEDFPVDLILVVRDASVKKSDRSIEGDLIGQSQILSVTYTTKAKVPDLFGAYVNYFSEHGYDLKKTESKEGEAVIQAERDGLGITIGMSVAGPQNQEVRIEVKRPMVQ
ncbi:hypothetical protein KW796_02955 [Candidatus Parcubacteria bacterium]|nr:hypothetical protein [Candidatus Parcubacteria bacterium]